MLKYIRHNPRLVYILGDNQGALALVKNPHLYKRSKHIDIYYYYIRDLEEKGKLNINYIPTSNIVVDGMTKPLRKTAFKRFKKQIGFLSKQ